jgi:ribosomal protein L9
VLGKIVTAPFRALGKLFGGSGDKLEAITFEAGGAVLSPPELEKVKMVSTALAKRQGLALGIVPAYDEALDTAAVRELTIRTKVAEEMGLKLAEGQAAGPIDLNNAKVQKAIDNLYDTLTKKSLLKKLASKLEKPKEGHYEEALQKLTASIQVSDADLKTLAKSRGEAIQKALLAAGVSVDRMHIDAPEKHKGDGNAKDVNTRLTLDVNQKVSVKVE